MTPSFLSFNNSKKFLVTVIGLGMIVAFAGTTTAFDLTKQPETTLASNANEIVSNSDNFIVRNSNSIYYYDYNKNLEWQKSYSETITDIAIDENGLAYVSTEGSTSTATTVGHVLNSTGDQIATASYDAFGEAIGPHPNEDSFYMGTPLGSIYKYDFSGNRLATSSEFGRTSNIEFSDGHVFVQDDDGVIKLDGSNLNTVWTKSNNAKDIDVINGEAIVARGTNGLTRYSVTGAEKWTLNGDYLKIEASNEFTLAYDGNANEGLESIDSNGDRISDTNSDNVFDVSSSYVLNKNGDIEFLSTYSLPSDDTITNESTNLATGSFALSTSAGLYSSLKGASAVIGGLSAWELGIEDWLFGSNENDGSIFKSDIRSNAEVIEEQRNNIIQSQDFTDEVTFGTAMAEAKVKAIEALNQNETKTQAKEDVEQVINDYYSDIERTIVNAYNNEVLNIEQDEANANALNVDFQTVFTQSFSDLGFIAKNRTLPNGEELRTYVVKTDSGSVITDIGSAKGSGLTTDGDGDTTSAKYAPSDEHYQLIQDVRNSRSNAITNVNSIVDQIYNDYTSGEVELTEEASPIEIVEGLSSNYAETGTYDYQALTLALTGTPSDLNSAFNITYNSENYEGTLLASEAVVGTNGEIEANTTYDGSQGEAIFVAQKNETSDIIDLTGSFTVNSITSLKDGESLSNTTLQQEEAYTTNVTNLENQLSSIQEDLDEVDSPTGGFIGGTSFSLEAIGAIGVLVALLLASS